MRRALAQVVIIIAAHAAPAEAQTLSARPAIFADPVLVTDPGYGELVLGRTTLIGARRIFALELGDSVSLPPGHGANPAEFPESRSDSASWPKLQHRLDLGNGRYTLYFDKHGRLVMVSAERSRLPRTVRREDLVARYPSLRVLRSWSGQDELIAPLAPCISLLATVSEREDEADDPHHPKAGTVIRFGYRFTCRTRPSPVLPPLDEP